MPDTPLQLRRLMRRLAFLRPALINSTIALVALAISVGAAEMAVRIVAPQQLIQVRPDIWQPVDSLGWARRPNLETTINTGERAVTLRTDTAGFRIGTSPRRENGIHLLLLGDSFAAALQVEYEESLPGLLETTLPPMVGAPVVVRNGGVDGWEPIQYLIQARRSLAAEPIDAVIVMLYLGNDVTMRQVASFPPREPSRRVTLRFPRQLSWKALVDDVLYPVNDWAEKRSHLFVLLKNRLSTLQMRLGLTAAYFPSELLRTEASSPRWRMTADICRDLAQAAADHGVPTVFVLVPAPHQVQQDVLAQYVLGFGLDTTDIDVDQPNRLLGDALHERELMVVDPLEAMREAYDQGKTLFGSVDRHLNPTGHELLAGVVAPAIRNVLVGTSVKD